MGRPKKDPALVRGVPLNFRVSSTVKNAIDELSRRYAAETGDDSLTGWFLAVVHREARAAGVPIVMGVEKGEALEPKRAPLPAKPTKRKAKGADRSGGR